MRFLSRENPFRIGIAAGIAGAIAGVGVLALSVTPIGASTYEAEFEHTAGLREGEGVQIAGVEVGEVRGVDIQGERVVVEFTVDDDIPLGSQTEAQVKVGTLLGNHFLAIDPQGEGTLPDDRIPLARTSVPFNLQDVIDAGTAAVDEIDAETVGEALSAVADTLRAADPHLAPAFDGVARISRVIKQREGQIGELLRASKLISDQLANSTGDLVRLMEQSNLVIGEIVKRRDTIRDLLHDVLGVTESINGILDDNEADFGPILRDLDALVSLLRSRDQDLRQALHNLAVTSRYFANATGDGPFMNLFLPDAVPDKIRCGPTGGC